MQNWINALVVMTALTVNSLGTVSSLGQGPQLLEPEQRRKLKVGLKELQETLVSVGDHSEQGRADATIYAKGLTWALRYDSEFTPKDVELLDKALNRGKERAAALATNNRPWCSRTGKVALGYVSKVDGSVQPYGLIVPRDYDPARAIRLDVVLHGSTFPIGMSELRFMDRFDDAKNAFGPDQSFLELHPLGRVENCYRWAGETDVFEAIEDVCRRYHVDRRRIVLRGMSMGASGAWHLGLKHPDRFVALGPYSGYVDTHRFSETPLPTFVKVGPLPAYQEMGLHMLDSVDYAENARMVPAIACMGEKDIFFQAHVLMGEAMRREGLAMVNLISPGTGHVIDPVTHAEQMRRIGEIAERGLDLQPKEIRFVTWTLKYSRCHWLQVLGLEQHYVRADVSARLQDEGVEVTELKNITRFAILTSKLASMPKWFRIDGVYLTLPDSLTAKSKGVVIARKSDNWFIEGDLGRVVIEGKRPGLQGPIDDAFTGPFLCVRGTGQPWNAAVQDYSDASLKRFADEWSHYFRGELPIKNDSEVTDEDLRTRHLVLFGDPGSNPWIARMLPKLPLSWTTKTLRLGGREYPASIHVPAMIALNPLDNGNGHYVVLNSGHTFHETELGKLNYLLFPRWGDWAVLEIEPNPSDRKPLSEKVIQAGYCDEHWH